MAELSTGDELAGYRIEAVAGRGGMGVVYRATDLTLDREVALKLISDELGKDETFRERFRRVSRLAASIRHANVITVFRAGEEDGSLFIAMDYIEGTDLKALIASQGRLDPALAARIVWQVGQALDAAHAKTLVHRDVKPANVLIASEKGSPHAYLTDFGLTKNVGSETGMTKTGVVVGTIDYMAPEQVAGLPIDGRVDIYSLGCVLWEALTGKVPFPRDSAVAKMYAHTHEDPPSLAEVAPDVPAAFEGVVTRAMAKRPEERYLSAGDLGEAALAAAEGRSIELSEKSVAAGAAAPVEDAPPAVKAGATAETPATPTAESPGATTERPAPARPRGRGRLIAAAAAGLVALAIVLALLLSGGGGDDNGSSGSGGGGAQLSKDAYQDKVIDAQQDVNTKFATIGSRLPQNLDDPVKAAQASRDLVALRESFDGLIAKLKAIDPPADVKDLHNLVIKMVGTLRGDIADAGAAASFNDGKAYTRAGRQLAHDSDALDSLADDFARRGYTRLSLGG
jgi:serine/threonine-protein kinase